MHQKPFKRQCPAKPLSEEEIVIEEEASPFNALEKDFPGQKRKLIESGGFLGALLGPIISVLGGLFNGAR